VKKCEQFAIKLSRIGSETSF